MSAPLNRTALATAIRMVEATRAQREGYVYEGPEPEWFNGYAEDIAREYERLTAPPGARETLDAIRSLDPDKE